jgi:hypothetical protein
LSRGTFVIAARSFLPVMNVEKKFRNHTVTILVLLLTITSGVYLAAKTVHRANAVTATPATFTNYELAGNPFFNTANPPFSVGVTCPNSAGNCQNTEGEPQIRADKAGNFYGSSENVFCVIGGQCGGTFAWKSVDGGNSFTTLKLPNSASGTACVPPTGSDHCTSTGLSPAGGDTDLAVAPRQNSKGFYNVYVASLASAPPLFAVYVSVSIDGGANWVLNPTGASIPVDDREWIAADGANRVCVSYHSTLTTNEIMVQCGTVSSSGLIVFNPPTPAFDATHQFHAGFNNEIGNLAIDTGNHVIYQVFSSIADGSELIVPPAGTGCGVSCGTHAVWLARSIDGGLTFSDFLVYNNPNVFLSYGHQFVNVSVDKAGNVYVVYSDDHNLFYSFSTTFGQTWSGPFQINKPDSNTAIMPWSAAGNAGQLDVAWYGTSFYDGVHTPDNYPGPSTGTPAAWYVYFSQNLAATTSNVWGQVKASGIIHYGGVCEGGVLCLGNKDANRDLLDDFGVAASPTTGNAVIIYTSDQFVGTLAEPATTRSSGSPVCSLSTSNTVDCSHTDIAVQTGGSTINQNPGNFEEDSEDFEETNVSGNGGPQPHEEIDLTNTGTVAINTFSVAIGGLPWTLTWSSTSPIQPGQSVRATSNSVPLGLLLTVGTIYTVTITATTANGTTETHTINAIYTLGAGLGL